MQTHVQRFNANDVVEGSMLLRLGSFSQYANTGFVMSGNVSALGWRQAQRLKRLDNLIICFHTVWLRKDLSCSDGTPCRICRRLLAVRNQTAFNTPVRNVAVGVSPNPGPQIWQLRPLLSADYAWLWMESAGHACKTFGCIHIRAKD